MIRISNNVLDFPYYEQCQLSQWIQQTFLIDVPWHNGKITCASLQRSYHIRITFCICKREKKYTELRCILYAFIIFSNHFEPFSNYLDENGGVVGLLVSAHQLIVTNKSMRLTHFTCHLIKLNEMISNGVSSKVCCQQWDRVSFHCACARMACKHFIGKCNWMVRSGGESEKSHAIISMC